MVVFFNKEGVAVALLLVEFATNLIYFHHSNTIIYYPFPLISGSF